MRRPLLVVSLLSLGGGVLAFATGACVGDDAATSAGVSPEASIASEGGGGPDAAADVKDGGVASRCDPSAPFGQPEPIDELGTQLNQPAGWLSEDELTVHLSRANADAGLDLYFATRLTRTAKFGTPTLLTNLNSDVEDDNPTLTRDGLHIFFHSARGDDGGSRVPRLFVASRPINLQDFSPPELVGGIPVLPVAQLDPFIAPDGKTLYFAQDSAASGQDIYMAASEGDDTTFQLPVPIAELNSQSFELQPILTADETVVYFTSNRASGNFDVWRASRQDRTKAFGVPVREPTASSSLIDAPTWVSHDDCELWIARAPDPTSRSLLRLRRPPAP